MDDRLLSYLHCFNVEADYYECHEYGESLWLDTGRPVVLKGLIQAAVCLYHLQNGNVRGGYAMWLRAKGYLTPSLPVYESMDLTALLRDIDAVFARVPQEWRDHIVTPEQIVDLQLPIVRIRLCDEALEQTVVSWTPTPIE